jgi:hypothetical protein
MFVETASVCGCVCVCVCVCVATQIDEVIHTSYIGCETRLAAALRNIGATKPDYSKWAYFKYFMPGIGRMLPAALLWSTLSFFFPVTCLRIGQCENGEHFIHQRKVNIYLCSCIYYLWVTEMNGKKYLNEQNLYRCRLVTLKSLIGPLFCYSDHMTFNKILRWLWY